MLLVHPRVSTAHFSHLLIVSLIFLPIHISSKGSRHVLLVRHDIVGDESSPCILTTQESCINILNKVMIWSFFFLFLVSGYDLKLKLLIKVGFANHSPLRFFICFCLMCSFQVLNCTETICKSRQLPGGWRTPSQRHIFVGALLLFVAVCLGGDIVLLSDTLSSLASFL